MGIVFNANSQTSIPVPFFQPFDSFLYNSPPNTVYLEVADESNPSASGCPMATDFVTGRNYSWALSTRGNPIKGKSLKFTVHPEDKPCLSASSPNSRSEIRYILQPLQNTATYFKWEMYIPDDAAFEDDNPVGSYHKLFQIIANDNLVTYPLVGLDYYHAPGSFGQARDIRFLIRSAVDSTVFRRVNIAGGITKGEWTEIVYKSYWSNSDTVGSVQIWINGKPVILDPLNPNNIPPNPENYYCILGSNLSDNPLEVNCATISLIDGTPARAKFKFGHYRQNHHTYDHSIYIDDLKVTPYPPIAETPTELAFQYCNANVPIDNYNMSCNSVIGATNYKFRFEKDPFTYFWTNSSDESINLLDYSFLEPATTYKVQVRAQGSNFDFDYGDICTITTPHKTKLRGADCDNLNADFNTNISALKVLKATNYKFEFKDVVTNALFYGNTYSSSTFINPSSITGLIQGRLYKVRVRAQGLPEYDFDYGEECSIRFNSNARAGSKIHNNQKLIGGEFEVVPNPFDDTISIIGVRDTVLEQIKIFDLSGKVVFESSGADVVPNIKLNFLDGGLYIVQLRTKLKVQSLKLIKR